MKLHLGVVDVPYSDESGGKTTGDVATILEGKYGVMENFVALHMDEIQELAVLSVKDAIDSLVQGAPRSIDPFAQAGEDVKQLFQTYLQDEEIVQTGEPGVPTEAAQEGRSSRFKLKLNKGKVMKGRKQKQGVARPSFIDTGLYQAAFKAWVD